MPASPLWLSLELAGLTTLLLMAIGIPLAAWISSGRSWMRWGVETAVTLPLVLPPTVLGFALLVVMGPKGPIGRPWETLTGSRLSFSFAGILFASIITNLPFAVRPYVAAIKDVDRRLVEASWCLGVSTFTTFRRVTLPLAANGIVAGSILTFAHSLGEFGVILMVGGNIPGVTRTLSLAIYDDVQMLNYAAATRSGLLMMGIATLAFLIARGLERSRRR